MLDELSKQNSIASYLIQRQEPWINTIQSCPIGLIGTMQLETIYGTVLIMDGLHTAINFPMAMMANMINQFKEFLFNSKI
jgi:hypothetical protein